MNKSFKHVFITSFLLLFIIGILSSASANSITLTPEDFLKSINNGTDFSGYTITIVGGEATVLHICTINANNTIIKTNGTVIFDGNSNNNYFRVTGNNVTIEGMTFTNFNGDNLGGAVLWTGHNGNLRYCNFIDNKAYDGGALYWAGNNGHVINCKFTNNAATNDGGGALYWTGNGGNVGYCDFTDNTAPYAGGALYWWFGANGHVEHCNFAYNDAKQKGGAIYWNSGASGTVEHSTFSDNNASFGGAVSWNANNGHILYSNFTHNIATQSDGAVYGKGYVIWCCSFINNTDGSVISHNINKNSDNSYEKMTDCNLTNNTKNCINSKNFPHFAEENVIVTYIN